MRRFHRSWLPLAAAILTALLVLPAIAQVAFAASSSWTAQCSANVRTSPKTSATIKNTISAGTVVTSSGTVTGGSWSSSCTSSTKGSTWLKITAIGGKTTTSLFGLSAVYAATGIFKVKVTTTDYLANCSVRLRTSTSTSATTKAIIDVNSVVTSASKVTGGSWAAECAGSVSGSSWYKIIAVGGKSVSSLYGVSAVYAATGLFRVLSTTPTTIQEGIDVSHWQGTIDWAKVKAAGKTFAIAKASEGIGWEDDTYDRNKAGAMAQGIKFGAYHFARPGSNDPVQEADWFVDTAAYEHGMLIPTLDLELTGGLSTTALTNWVKAWLQRVDQRLGVKAMIYTSPSFWGSYMGDTRWFADNGYAVVWVANWGVTSPSVPASSWGGRSWTFWQYTSDGTVPGISGRVDLDRYRFSTFAAVTY
ncbi:MAG: glycoside hydrolase family 25 protein [Candidatus Limnocylindrales bacterium]